MEINYRQWRRNQSNTTHVHTTQTHSSKFKKSDNEGAKDTTGLGMLNRLNLLDRERREEREEWSEGGRIGKVIIRSREFFKFFFLAQPKIKSHDKT